VTDILIIPPEQDFDTLAGYYNPTAADQTQTAMDATNVDLQQKLQDTQGVISTQSTTAIVEQNGNRAQAAQAIQNACNEMSTWLLWYYNEVTGVDDAGADSIAKTMQP